MSQVRVSRNKKTGHSKHYAFLEFQTPDIAKIAAEAMDGYMMFKQKLSVRVMLAKEVSIQPLSKATLPGTPPLENELNLLFRNFSVTFGCIFIVNFHGDLHCQIPLTLLIHSYEVRLTNKYGCADTC